MKANKIKNSKIRTFFFNKEISRNLNKFLEINLLNVGLKKELSFFHPNTKKKTKVKIKNKCVLTGCNHSVNKIYNISRVEFRRLLQIGIISNYNKSVW